MYAFVTTYVAVLFAELIGDRSLLSIGCLSAQHGARHVLIGATPAFMFKTLVAVVFGAMLGHLSRGLVTSISAITFLVGAVHILRAAPCLRESTPNGRSVAPAAWAAFATIACSEWADIGQFTAAAMAARFGNLTLVWSAATMALITKAGLAAMLGSWFGSHLQAARLRWGAAGVFVVMAILALARID